jgi:hypothetical protein
MVDILSSLSESVCGSPYSVLMVSRLSNRLTAAHILWTCFIVHNEFNRTSHINPRLPTYCEPALLLVLNVYMLYPVASDVLLFDIHAEYRFWNRLVANTDLENKFYGTEGIASSFTYLRAKSWLYIFSAIFSHCKSVNWVNLVWKVG